MSSSVYDTSQASWKNIYANTVTTNTLNVTGGGGGNLVSTSGLTAHKLPTAGVGNTLANTNITCTAGSGNLTGVGDISAPGLITFKNGAFLEGQDSTANPPSIRAVADQPWQIGGSHISDDKAHFSMGYDPATSGGLLYAFRQGDGPKNIQYGFPGFGVGHTFEGKITITGNDINGITVPATGGTFAKLTDIPSAPNMVVARIAADGSISYQAGARTVSVVPSGSGVYTLSLSGGARIQTCTGNSTLGGAMRILTCEANGTNSCVCVNRDKAEVGTNGPFNVQITWT